MNTENPSNTVALYFESLGNGTSAWQEYLDDTISFIGPIDQVEGKEAYIALTLQFFPLVKTYSPLKHFGNDQYVLQEGIYTVNGPNGETIDLKCAEIFEVTNGKIQKIQIYYDPTEFKQAFGLTKHEQK